MALSLLLLKLTVDGKPVVGESTTNGYEGQIELDSFEWAVTAKHTALENQPGVSTEVRPKVLTLSKTFDRSSALLCQHANQRKHYASARITALSMTLAGTNDGNLKMMEMVLSDGFLEDVSLQASESGKAISVKEKVTLSFVKCQLLYYPVDPKRPVRSAAMTFDLDEPSHKT